MRRIVCIWMLVLAAAASAQQPDLNANMGNLLKGKIFFLRSPSSSSLLKFSADGMHLNKQESGPWTLYAQIQVDKTEVKDRSVDVTGKRVFVRFDQGSKEKLLVARDMPVRVEIVFQSAPTEAEIVQAFNKVFLAPGEHRSDVVSDIWKPYLLKQENPSAADNSTPSGTQTPEEPRAAFKVGNGVTPPKGKVTPDPVYDPIARAYKLEGSTTLYCVVTPEGRASDIRVAKPLGLGFDDRAAEKIATWRFEPGKKDGVPVPVQINVEVNFRLY